MPSLSRALALAALAASAPAFAQTAPAEPLRPGAAALDFSALTLTDTVFEVRLVQPMAQSIGSITDTYVLDASTGTVTAISLVKIPMAGQNVADTTVFAWPSMAPLSRRSSSPSERVSIDFADGRATGTSRKGTTSTPIDVALAKAVFGPGSMTRIVRALPLTEGYTATVASLDEDEAGGVSLATIEVLGTRDVQASDGSTVTVRAVQVTDGEESQLYLIDPATRDLIRMEFSPQPGVIVHIVRT